MRVMSAASEACAGFLRGLRERGRGAGQGVKAAVRAILDDVRERGDAAHGGGAARARGRPPTSLAGSRAGRAAASSASRCSMRSCIPSATTW